jgi:hypothetical protein
MDKVNRIEHLGARSGTAITDAIDNGEETLCEEEIGTPGCLTILECTKNHELLLLGLVVRMPITIYAMVRYHESPKLQIHERTLENKHFEQDAHHVYLFHYYYVPKFPKMTPPRASP